MTSFTERKNHLLMLKEIFQDLLAEEANDSEGNMDSVIFFATSIKQLTDIDDVDVNFYYDQFSEWLQAIQE